MGIKSIQDAYVNEKRVLVRCDFDITIDEKGKIIDETRLISAVSTLEYLLENGATVIAIGHLGRPEPHPTKENDKFSLLPVAKWFAGELGEGDLHETSLGDFKGWQLKRNFFILENLRFYKEEEENGKEFSEKLANLADIYVNEAFGSSHREHASIAGVCDLLPHFAGFHLVKEVKVLTGILERPKRPLTFLIGGAKIETKLPLISKMHEFADYVLVGGELAEQDKVLIKEQHSKINNQKALLLVADLTQDKFDITKMSVENFEQVFMKSKCIVWNGPMGFVEKGFDEGSLMIAKAIASSSAYKVVGGGDTVSFLNDHKLLDKFDFASVGGGAMLEFLSGVKLPGLVALENST